MTAPDGRLFMTLRRPDRTGAPKMALEFARALRADGFDLTLVHGRVPGDGPSILPDVAGLGIQTVLEPLLERPWDPRLVRALAERVRRDGGRCVIGVNRSDRAPALLAATRAGVPGVLMVQNQHHFSGPLAAVKRRGYRTVVARRTTLAVCTSTVVRDEMTAFGVPAGRTVVLPNGISPTLPVQLTDAERAGLRAEMGARDGDLLLLNVGRLDPQKGQDVLLEALSGLSAPIHVALVGSAGDSAAAARHAAVLHRQTRDLGLEGTVSFLGWRDDVPRLLAAADGYVHTARWEGPALPLAVMEAMAAGRPTVFTDCSGQPPVFDEGRDGLLARSEDPASIRERIAQLAAMRPEDRAAMGDAGAALIRAHYRVEDLGRTFSGLVRGVLDAGYEERTA
ncbi:glycosyltransferase family 4 protein [Geodermatophilus sabuli]|uniref:Glycosyltransferase family 4 protein n=1 Tax=Geodermatophilus sabuli TaxID=1564158 RepID=A0A7K3W396_9ACTN|nr:glycosyltransferase family 4 protein [Geodermatophilus sabuli]NEK59345.1 glycosyltransferase family 4 protein [Geodermatophilus sabuli]